MTDSSLFDRAASQQPEAAVGSSGIKERPILFSAPMVRALLDGSKTQTRRIVKGWPLEWLAEGVFKPEFVADPGNHGCPHGVPGDRLWVRETYFAFGRWETRFSAKKGRDEWHFVDMTVESGRAYQFVAPAEYVKAAHKRGSVTPTWWKRPAIFMPRAASRITLEIISARVERLQSISEADAMAEGIERDGGCWRDYMHPETRCCVLPYHSYMTLWESINSAGCWDVNPWVWVVEFKRASATEHASVELAEALKSDGTKPPAAPREPME